MHLITKTIRIFFLVLLAFSLFLGAAVQARPAEQEVTAFDLIIAMNTLRMSLGNPALVEDPIINAVAQATAEIMAANQMSWHIGDVSGRLQAAGFGGGAKVWGTENFAVGGQHSIDTIMQVWADPSHMIPAENPAYCAVGAGVAKSSNGMTYYVLQAAYTAGKSCGDYKPPAGFNPQTGGGQTGVTNPGYSQLIVPVNIATPDAEGKIYHEVKAGQSFWAIAVAYQITIKDIETWNNISKETRLQVGQKLFIPGKDTIGYATPTPVGFFLTATPDADGKIVHKVAPYQALSLIAQAYQVDLATILALNSWQEDWPLQIGQELIIQGSRVTPSPTPVPLTPLQKLTPAADGKYYHTIESGETLSWIAALYEMTTAELMAPNSLNENSIIQPGQKLVLAVTPPATATYTPGPPTATASATLPPTALPSSPTPSREPVLSPTVVESAQASGGRTSAIGIIILAIGIFGLGFIVVFMKRK